MERTQRWVLRQMAVAAGKKGSVSLSLVFEVNDLEVEEELSTLATQALAEGVWIGKWRESKLLRFRLGDK